MTINPSAVVALNRAIAVAQCDGPERGLEAIQAIAGSDRLAAYRGALIIAQKFGPPLGMCPAP